MFSGLPPKADLTSFASSSRTPPSPPRASWRNRASGGAISRGNRNRKLARSQSLLAKDQQKQPQALPNADQAKAA
jgi:hypothetical protein